MKQINLILIVAAAAAIAGCEARDNKKMWADGTYRLVDQQSDTMAAKGALEDGMLYPRHFSGDKLNTLGQTKLSLIARASKDSTDTVNVYLNMPKDQATDLRKQVVEQFMAERGITDKRLALAVGPNPGVKATASLTSSKMYEKKSTDLNEASDLNGYGAPAEVKK
jgi:hypothetical protein